MNCYRNIIYEKMRSREVKPLLQTQIMGVCLLSLTSNPSSFCSPLLFPQQWSLFWEVIKATIKWNQNKKGKTYLVMLINPVEIYSFCVCFLYFKASYHGKCKQIDSKLFINLFNLCYFCYHFRYYADISKSP